MFHLRLALRRCTGLNNLSPPTWSRALAPSLLSPRLYTTLPPPPDLSEAERGIYQKLAERFSPSALRVQDISGGCGAFYAIIIESDKFKGLPMVKQHQLVNDTLEAELKIIHGLQLKTVVPE